MSDRANASTRNVYTKPAYSPDLVRTYKETLNDANNNAHKHSWVTSEELRYTNLKKVGYVSVRTTLQQKCISNNALFPQHVPHRVKAPLPAQVCIRRLSSCCTDKRLHVTSPQEAKRGGKPAGLAGRTTYGSSPPRRRLAGLETEYTSTYCEVAEKRFSGELD